jgi:hypothetical protein
MIRFDLSIVVVKCSSGVVYDVSPPSKLAKTLESDLVWS